MRSARSRGSSRQRAQWRPREAEVAHDAAEAEEVDDDPE